MSLDNSPDKAAAAAAVGVVVVAAVDVVTVVKGCYVM